MATMIQLRRGTAAEWTAADTVLADGEEGYETDTGKRKIGDGATAWTALAYAGSFDPTADETISGAWDFTGGVTQDGSALALAASVTAVSDSLTSVQANAPGVCIEVGGAYPARPDGYAYVIFRGVDDPSPAGLNLMVEGDDWVDLS